METNTESILDELVKCLELTSVTQSDFEKIHKKYNSIVSEYDDTVNKLNKEFLTPFDREDILTLSAAYEHLGRDVFVVISEYAGLRSSDTSELIDGCRSKILDIKTGLAKITHQIAMEDIEAAKLLENILIIKYALRDTFALLELYSFTHLKGANSWKEGLFLFSFTRNIRMVLNRLGQITQAYEQIIIKGL